MCFVVCVEKRCPVSIITAAHKSLRHLYIQALRVCIEQFQIVLKTITSSHIILWYRYKNYHTVKCAAGVLGFLINLTAVVRPTLNHTDM